MEQFSTNDNVISGNNETIEICMNVILEDGSEENPSVQIETSKSPKNGSEEIMKENLEKLHVKGKFGNHM
jgi:hypothetical protein